MLSVLANSELQQLISACFSADRDLIEKYHVHSGQGLDECISKTVSDLDEAHSSFRFYKIEQNGELVGFFGTEYENYLTTIFVLPQFRNSQSLAEVWKVIDSNFDQDFYTAIYSKNLRAIKFYSRNGHKFEELRVGEHNVTTFKFSKEGK